MQIPNRTLLISGGNVEVISSTLLNFTEISDQDLVRLCLANQREAWNEFFRRYIPDIKDAIKNRLRNCGYDNMAHNQDIIWDIHEKIVVKLIKKKILNQCENPIGIRFWLRKIAINQTTDWLIEQGRKKRLPQKQIEDSRISLSNPIMANSNPKIEDTISDDPVSKNKLQQHVEYALQQITEIKNSKKKWVLRLSIIYSLPLSQKEFDDLADFSGYSTDELKKRLNKMALDVEKKEQKRVQELGKAILFWHEIRRLENKLFEQNKDRSTESQKLVETLEHKIDFKIGKREVCLKKGNKYPRPSNKDIADIVGVPENQVNQISNLLNRARNLMEKLSF